MGKYGTVLSFLEDPTPQEGYGAEIKGDTRKRLVQIQKRVGIRLLHMKCYITDINMTKLDPMYNLFQSTRSASSIYYKVSVKSR